MDNKNLFLKKILISIDEDINDSEYNVLKDLINRMDTIQKYSIREAAKNNFISTASISRLCYKFELSGYSELKFYLKAEYDKFTEKACHKEKSLKNKFSSIIKAFNYNYNKIVENIDEAKLDELLEILCLENSISVCGSGLSEVMALYFSQRFQMVGKKVNFINLNAPSEVYKNQLRDTAGVIIFSKSGEIQTMQNKIQIAEEMGSKLILFTSKNKNKVSNSVDITVEICGNNKRSKEKEIISSYNSNVIIIIDILVELYIENMRLSDSI